MYIKQIQLSNFQVIKELDANFEGNVYFVTGDNELGKSTLLKAIGILLTGNRDAVLKNGEDKGFAKMIVGDDGENYEVDLRFTKANPRGTLSIKAQSTGMRSENVSMLQKIFGYQDFDAVEFSRWSETAEGRRRQVEVVKALLPEAVQKRIAEIDSEVVAVKDTRKEDNADLKTCSAIVSNLEREVKPGDIVKYAKPIDMKDLIEAAQLAEKAKGIKERRAERQKQLDAIPTQTVEAAEAYKAAISEADSLLAEAQKEYDRIVAEAKAKLETAKTARIDSERGDEKAYKEAVATIEATKADCETRIANADQWLADYNSQFPEGVDTENRAKQAEEHNAMHAKAKEYNEKLALKKAVEKKIEAHESKLHNLSKERENIINQSELPIAGLTFTDDGLELNGVPFVAGKVSDSQIMEVAAKLIISSNPTVKVFRIARGESLGEKRLQSLIDLAKKSGYQGFIEQVVRGQNDMIIEEYKD